MDERVTDRSGRVVDWVTESGDVVTSAWGLPDPSTETVRWHHHPEAAVGDGRLCATVSVANDWCVKHGVVVRLTARN